MFKTIRIQFLLVLMFFGGLNLVMVVGYFQLSKNQNQLEYIEQKVSNIQLMALTDAKNINDFFTYDTRSTDYFVTKKSTYLIQHKKLHQDFLKSIKALKAEDNIILKNYSFFLDSILTKAYTTNNLLDSITHLIFIRGFKDYGTEGTMRQYAHYLETLSDVDKVELLMLRRHEKDYIIRNENKYIKKFNELIDSIVIKNKNNKGIIKEFANYKGAFNQMVALDRVIGLKDNTSLKRQLENELNSMVYYSEKLNYQCKILKNNLTQRFKKVTYWLIGFTMGMALLLSFAFSRRITRRITILSESISKYIDSCFTSTTPIAIKNQQDEMGLLIANFEIMRNKITDQLNHLEVKVAERTEEITIQKEQIQEQNNKLLDSLKYALHIQEALLPNRSIILKTLPNHFIFYKPKDLVSGDFYWYKHIKNPTYDISVFVVADCTGHGVPGAFMSMLGIAFLNEIVIRKEIKTSADILNHLRVKVIENLAQQSNNHALNDGLDVSLVIFDHKRKTFQFSGANRDLYFIRNSELIHLKGNRMPIGKYLNIDTPFTYIEMVWQSNDWFYMFTDGFADQEGGSLGRKYLRKNLRELLLRIHKLPIEEQKNILELEFYQWKNGMLQTDDVLIAGIQMN